MSNSIWITWYSAILFLLFFYWHLTVFCESPLFTVKIINLLFLRGEKKKIWHFQRVVFRWGQKGGASVMGTAWHVQAPVRCLQSLSIKKKIRPAECCLTRCIYLLKLVQKSTFPMGCVGLVGSLWVCSLIYLWTKTCAVESVEILHKR